VEVTTSPVFTELKREVHALIREANVQAASQRTPRRRLRWSCSAG
jgi:hypothetical protein